LRKENWHVLLAICLTGACICLTGIFQACGVKGDPLTPRLPAPAVTDLKVSRVQGAVQLQWTVPDERTDVARIKVFRSALETGGEDCPGCPRTYELIDEAGPRDSKVVRDGGRGMTYVDAGIRVGRLYTYKIVLCNAAGNCSGDSNTADIRIKE